MSSRTVLLAGGTGMLGQRIVDHLLSSENVDLRLLVRPKRFADGDADRTLDGFVARGATVVPAALTDGAGLDRATEGVDVVVSALQGGREIIVDGQVALARAAAGNGVQRIIPSDFAVDLFKATPGDQPSLDLRREADEEIARTGLEQINVLNGAFLDGVATPNALVTLDDEAGIATYWGSGEERFDVTTVDDTARYTARVALDPGAPAGTFAVAADHVTMEDLRQAFERAGGRRYAAHSLGSLDDLRDWVRDQRDAGNEQMAGMGGYVVYLLSGQTRLTNLQNDRYPDIVPTTLANLPIALPSPAR